MRILSKRPPLVAVSLIFLAALGVAPVRAADDLAIVGDIPMPDIPMPHVDVDVRVGEVARPVPPAPYARPYPRGPFAAMTPQRYLRELPDRPAVPPHQIAAMLRSTGYSLLGPVNRRGWVYTVAVLDPRGDDGRAVVDARTGAIIRFVRAINVDARFNDELEMVYGPPGPPPMADASYDNRHGSLTDLKRAPRPAVAFPRTAQQPAPKVGSGITIPSAKPPVTAVMPIAETSSATAENKSSGTTVGVATASVPAAQTQTAPPSPAPELKMWPTQAMPEAQSFD